MVLRQAETSVRREQMGGRRRQRTGQSQCPQVIEVSWRTAVEPRGGLPSGERVGDRSSQTRRGDVAVALIDIVHGGWPRRVALRVEQLNSDAETIGRDQACRFGVADVSQGDRQLTRPCVTRNPRSIVRDIARATVRRSVTAMRSMSSLRRPAGR